MSKPATDVTATSELTVLTPPTPWVNRGAEKLVRALDVWPIVVGGRTALDVGASTGGFTQVLLDRGARHVVALDVGHGQLHPTVAGDPRVENRERCSIRDLDPASLPPMDLVVADLSFISLTLALPAMVAVGEADGDFVLLVKPQFEVGRARLGKNGLVARPADRAHALRTVVAAAEGLGLHVHGLTASPMRGTHGNVEYLLWLRPNQTGRMEPSDLVRTIESLSVTDQVQ